MVHRVVGDLEQLGWARMMAITCWPCGGLAHHPGGEDRGADAVGDEEVHDVDRRVHPPAHVEGERHAGPGVRDRRGTSAPSRPRRDCRPCSRSRSAASAAGWPGLASASGAGDVRVAAHQEQPSGLDDVRVRRQRRVAVRVPGLQLRGGRAEGTRDRRQRVAGANGVLVSRRRRGAAARSEIG